MLTHTNVQSWETLVSGGCFCCRFDGLLGPDAAGAPEILLGEPVGSGTDLAATVLQPLETIHGQSYRWAPFSVLVDLDRVSAVLEPESPAAGRAEPDLPENVLCIYCKQLEKPDLIVLNKTDRLSSTQRASLEDALALAFPSPVRSPHRPGMAPAWRPGSPPRIQGPDGLVFSTRRASDTRRALRVESFCCSEKTDPGCKPADLDSSSSLSTGLNPGEEFE